SAFPALSSYNSPTGETLIQFAAPVILKGVLLVAMAAVMLCVRHPGPTSWWTAAVTVIALVGLSDRFTLSPSVFGLFGVASVLWMLHAYEMGRTWSAWLLVPLELLWVNVDSSFALGFVLVGVFLLCHVLGRALGRPVNQEAVGGKSTILAAGFVLAL